MGGGRWTSDDYTSYARTTNYREAPIEQVFHSGLHPDLDPRRITLRESCDSADNPNSTPIIFGADVTGSMGRYAALIAKEALPQMMSDILEQKPVSDPHLMFMAIDDVHASSRAALQVSQFEADIRILTELRKIFIVEGGGGNRSESYDLPWYFAAHKTKIDSLKRRGQKGFLFTMGDEEAPYQVNSPYELQSVFGASSQQAAVTPAQALKDAKELYHVFHIVIEQGGYYRERPTAVRESWTELLGTNVLFLKDFQHLSELVILTMKTVQGQDFTQLLNATKNPEAMRHAFHNALTADV
jgi:hypothetical protein